MLSGSGGAAEEEEITSVRERAVGEGPIVFLERIPGRYKEEVTLRAVAGGGGVGAKEEAEWRRYNRVLGRGKSNVTGTTYGSKVASNNP